MKTPAIYIISMLFISGCVLSSCDNSTGPESMYDFPAPIDSVATDISLYVHPVYYDSLLTIMYIPMEDTIIFDYNNQQYPPGSFYRIYARAEGFYPELMYGRTDDTLIIDLDAIPRVAYSITGVVLARDGFPVYAPLPLELIRVTGPDGFDESIQADGCGRYGLANIPAGIYAFSVCSDLDQQVFYIENTPGTDYQELRIHAEAVIEAPYIYLYPETESDIQIELEFLVEGHLTESEPPYNGGWDVHVTPEGVIDGSYDYLFYEGALESVPHSRTGWVLNGNTLERDINRLLSELGFNSREIEDFTDFWVPVIEGHPYYAFYYLDPDSIIRLNVNPSPDNILRAFFIIRPLRNSIRLRTPDISERFLREGFALVEWGVIDWRE